MRNGIAPTTVSSSVQLNIQIHKTAKTTLGTRACCQGSIWYSFVMGILSAIVRIAAIIATRKPVSLWETVQTPETRSALVGSELKVPTEANMFFNFILLYFIFLNR